jgi:hypothetical protein
VITADNSAAIAASTIVSRKLILATYTAPAPQAMLARSHIDKALSEAAMDAPRRVFNLIELSGGWYWRLDIKNDDGLIGPFSSKDEAEEDARETLGLRE